MMTDETKQNEKNPEANCNVNSTFNFVVGGVAIVVALAVFYFARLYL